MPSSRLSGPLFCWRAFVRLGLSQMRAETQCHQEIGHFQIAAGVDHPFQEVRPGVCVMCMYHRMPSR